MVHKVSPLPVILLFGKNGQIGFELRRSLAPLGRVVALGRADCDLTQPDQLRQAVRVFQPDVVINAAAYTAVDNAETEPDAALAVNGVAPGVLAEMVRATGGLLVHYSSDYVFDGAKGCPYLETDVPNPQSVYGRTKLEGERAIAASEANALVLRTSWVAGAHGDNFVKAILRQARERTHLRVIAEQLGAPTSASLIADVTAQIVARHWVYGERDAFMPGVYHLAAAGQTTWHGYASEVLRYAAGRCVDLKAAVAGIEAIPAVKWHSRASRPANSCLDTSKLRETFGVYLPNWQEGIQCLLDQIFP